LAVVQDSIKSSTVSAAACTAIATFTHSVRGKSGGMHCSAALTRSVLIDIGIASTGQGDISDFGFGVQPVEGNASLSTTVNHDALHLPTQIFKLFHCGR
jgi:hypothetical protein